MSCAALASARAACIAPMSRALSRGRRHCRPRRALAASAAAEPPPASGKQKVCVITGANTGLGFISAREIAAKGHVVVLAVRDTDKGAKAASEIEGALLAEKEKGALDVMRLDLQDLQSIDRFVEAFSAKYDRCDVLMNNAGVMALPEKSLTVNGIETQMGTNHMGHFYLTEKMMPSIFAAKGRPRIVNLSSVAHEWGHIDFENTNSDGPLGYLAAGWLTYGRTKLANLYFTYELHRRLRKFGGDGARVDVNAVHPGIVDTELPRSLSFNFYPQLKKMGSLITPEQGARGQIEVAVGEAYENVSGKYVAETSGPSATPLGPKGQHVVAESSRWSYDRDAAERFWKVSKSMTGAVWASLGETEQPQIH
jgi:NAD(P)-dependent dehydrogenase (short-subunit alcohol dehydrogenase family)